MKKIFAFVLSAVICMTLLTGCSKFEEGPKFSILSKKSRLCKTWKFTSVTVLSSGTIITAWFEDITWDFEKNGDYTEMVGSSGVSGEWEFTGDTGLKVTQNSNVTTLTIIRLAKKEFILQDDTIEYKLEPN